MSNIPIYDVLIYLYYPQFTVAGRQACLSVGHRLGQQFPSTHLTAS